jgi:predicted transposase/invertase (TIGR01784 family)
MCQINPRVDLAFKKLFGSEENKDLLLSLLRAFLPDANIAEVVLKNPYNLADYRAGKISILDIKACDEQGRWFNVEMQIGEDLYFDKRAIYYWAKLVTEQLTEGRLFRELKKTYSINILDFDFIPDRGECHNCYKIINIDTGKDDKLHDIFELHYLELGKFQKTNRQIVTALDRWSTFLTRAHEFQKHHVPPELATDSAIIKAIQAVDRMFNEEERQMYEVRWQAFADVESKIISAELKGEQRGELRGELRGEQRGLQQGLERGKLEVARAMLAKGMDIATVANLTGLNETLLRSS